MVKVNTDAEALKPLLEVSADSQLSEAERLDQQTSIALDEVDKVVSNNASDAAGGLDKAFALGSTEITPQKIRLSEKAQAKQIEKIVQDTTTRIDRVLKRSSDNYISTLPKQGLGNLERILWKSRAKQVKNKITAVSTLAKDSVFVAEGLEAFYGEARNRAEQELTDQMAKFNDFQEKYGESSWLGRRFSANKRKAQRFEAFQAPMQAALRKRLDEMDGRIEGIKSGPHADKVSRMAEKVDRRFKHASADTKIKLWNEIQTAVNHPGDLGGVVLTEFIPSNDDDEKALMVEAIVSGQLPWVKERLGIKVESDQKFANQAAVIASARDQESMLRNGLSLPSTDTLDSLLGHTHLKDKEKLDRNVSTSELVSALENDFRTNNHTKDLIENWFKTLPSKYELITDATKLHLILDQLQRVHWDPVEHLSLETQQMLITWLTQIEAARGGNVEAYEASKVAAAHNSLDELKGGVVAGGVASSVSVYGMLEQNLKTLEALDLNDVNVVATFNSIEGVVKHVRDKYKTAYLDTCADLDKADQDLLEAAWEKALDAADMLERNKQRWLADKQDYDTWKDNTNNKSGTSKARKLQQEIDKLDRKTGGPGSIKEAEDKLAGYPPAAGLSPEQIKGEREALAEIINKLEQRRQSRQAELNKIMEAPEPKLQNLGEITAALQAIGKESYVKHENSLKKAKTPTVKNFEDQLLDQLNREFAEQMEQTFLSELAQNDQYEVLQKLGRGARVQMYYKLVAGMTSMSFPDQLDNLDDSIFKVNRVIDGKVELVEEVAAGTSPRRVMVVTGPAFTEGNQQITARAGVGKQTIVSTPPDVYGPSINPEAAIVTNMQIL